MKKEITPETIRKAFTDMNAKGTAKAQARLMILNEFKPADSKETPKMWAAICSYVKDKYKTAKEIQDLPKALFDLTQWHFTEKKDFQDGDSFDEVGSSVETTIAGDYLMSFKHFSTRVFAPSLN